jgi:restriction endonuclease Mrr
MKGKSMTLIDGGKLIDLLIDHGVRVKKYKIEVLSVVADAFADLEPEA